MKWDELKPLVWVFLIIISIYFFLHIQGYWNADDIEEVVPEVKKIRSITNKVSNSIGITIKDKNKMKWEENKKYKTKSGLEFEVLKLGDGDERPNPEDKVKVHYKGYFPNGDVFDSSYKRGEPIVFPLNGVIRGWTEGLQYMNIGSKFKFTIPPELGYGNTQMGSIPANSTLIFEVELLDIIK